MIRGISPRLGNYLIVTDKKETEERYFEGLKASLLENKGCKHKNSEADFQS